jgi:UDP-2,4-diacetamido-2,4,6-trideoxy-beta-L-altropyranose hydrolase
MPLAVIRADASPTIGGGHVARCLALADALVQRGWEFVFASRPATRAALDSLAPGLVDMLELSGTADDEPAALRSRWQNGCDLLIVDHYERDADFEQDCRSWARTVLVVDDLANRRHACDVLVDPTPGRVAEIYDGLASGAEFLLDAPHALLRSRFAVMRHMRHASHQIADVARRVFIGFGATDPGNATGLALDAVTRCGRSLQVDVMLGRQAPHLDKVRAQATALPFPVSIHVDTVDVAQLMANADMAIGAGGTSALERCCLGLPSILVVIADNQRRVAGALAELGAAEVLGLDGGVSTDQLTTAIRQLVDDTCRRGNMALKASLVCDGLGVARVAEVVMARRAPGAPSVRLRPVLMSDSDVLLAWQREPGMRRHFRDPDPPDETAHRRWLEAKLEDPGCIFSLILLDGQPAGVVRLDRVSMSDTIAGPTFEVSILVAGTYRRMGVASAALAAMRRMVPWARLLAEVHPDNRQSDLLFQQAGFGPGDGDVRVAPPLVMS